MKSLRDIIKEKGSTNRVVADALGVSETNIRRYDDLSKRNIEEISIIAEALEIGLSELLNLAFENKKFVIIDEPDISLHPTSIDKAFDKMNGAFSKEITIPLDVWEVIKMQAKSLEKRDSQIDELISLLKDSKKGTADIA